MNRFQRRRWGVKFRQAKVESIPRKKGIDVLVKTDKDPTRLAGHEIIVHPCDWPGCQEEWEFSTMATLKGKRQIIARRCKEHRLSQKPAAE